MSIRWTQKRKLEVVKAVRSGAIGLDEACARYQLSHEEFYFWCSSVALADMRSEGPTAVESAGPASHRDAYVDWAVSLKKR